MDELCETLDAREAARVGVGTSNDGSATMAATPEESEEVREQHRRLLAEIRSCFRLLSIHSRLSGSESPRTRRISTQTDSCESLHSLAADRAKGNSPRVLRGLSPTEDAQNSLLYNQLIIESTSSNISGAASVGSLSHVGQQTEEEEEEEEPYSTESIHQRPVVNPTSRLKTVVSLSKADVINVVEWLYRDHPGAVWRAASRKAMEDQDDRKHLIYGEVTFVAFAKLLEKYAPHRPQNGSPLSAGKEKGKLLANTSEREDLFPCGFTFYDLGCGAGRPVRYSSLRLTETMADFVHCQHARNEQSSSQALQFGGNGIHSFSHSFSHLGVQPSREDVAGLIGKSWVGAGDEALWINQMVQPNLHPDKQSQKLDFLYGDFLQVDWSDADMIFTNATCFGDPLFSKFEEMATKVLKIGAIVISVTRPFNNLESWELLERQERQMSWAPALVYVYRKQVPNHPEVEIPSTSTAPEDIVDPRPPSSPEHIAQTVETFDKGTSASDLSPSNAFPAPT